MNTEKQRAFIIHFVYICIIITLLYVFLRYVMYAIMPSSRMISGVSIERR